MRPCRRLKHECGLGPIPDRSWLDGFRPATLPQSSSWPSTSSLKTRPVRSSAKAPLWVPITSTVFRAKFFQQYRLLFRYHAASQLIVFAWVNDENSKRAYGSSDDAYRVFRKMLEVGHPPDDWNQLLAEAQAEGQHHIHGAITPPPPDPAPTPGKGRRG
jgi:hypothetical protein